MSENTFDSQEINLQFQPLPAFIDTDGSFKLNTPMLSSFDFDGSIPKRDEPIDAIEVKPGYLIQIESGGEYFPVVSVEYDEPDIEDTGIVTINYIDDQGNTISADYDETDQISAVYEDWDEKVLGSQGWGITAGGNAIFTNVAVRGDLEATTLNVGGDDGITYDGTEVIIGASVTILGGLTIGDVSTYLNEEGYTTQDDLSGYVEFPDLASYATYAALSGNGTTTINGGNVSTGIIDSTTYNGTGDPINGTAFSTAGMVINLTTGAMISPSFRITNAGDATFKGRLEALSGYFGNETSGLSIGYNSDTGQAALETTTLKIGSQYNSGTIYGSINFYTTSGSSIGAVAATNSNKLWAAFGNGVGIGTTEDYFLLPGSGNSNRAKYTGNGFEWYGTGGSRIMTISGGTGGLRVENNTGGIQVSGGGNITVSGPGKFVGDGSGLTNLPGSGGGVTSVRVGTSGAMDGAVTITGAHIDSIGDGWLDGSALGGSSVGAGKLTGTLFTLGTTAITPQSTVTAITGGITLNGGATLGGGPTLQTGTNGFTTFVIGSGGTLRVQTLPLNLSGATNFVRYNSTTGALGYSTGTSALRFKDIVENNVDLSDSSWLDTINIVKFKYKIEEQEFGEDAPVRIGVIADELNNIPIFKEIVEKDSETGEVDSVQYDKLALYLIPIIKELRDKVSDLETRLEAAGI